MAEFDDIRKILDQALNELQSRAQLNKLGLGIIRKIKDRTRQGVFLEGATPGHESYSEGHRKKREKAGLPTGFVSLEFDDIDGMLQKVDHVVFADLGKVEIDITDPEKKKIAGYHHESGAGRSRVKRPFFDVSEDEAEDLRELVAEDLAGIIAELSNNFK